jgi:HD-like signal output (HDOD) protein
LDEIADVLQKSSAFSGFSPTVMKLQDALRNPDVQIEEITTIISLDPGLAARCLSVANTVAFAAGQPIISIDDAALRIGVRQLNRLAVMACVVDRFSFLKARLDWNRFWLHSILVGRLTDDLAACFRPSCGLEYLSGLLHDAGKLILQCYFPMAFSSVLLFMQQNHVPMHEAEIRTLGINHAEIGAALSQLWGLHPHITYAVWNHHSAMDPAYHRDPAADGGFLGCCIACANRMAHAVDSDPSTTTPAPEGDILSIPEWSFLQQFQQLRPINVDAATELAKVQGLLSGLQTASAPSAKSSPPSR